MKLRTIKEAELKDKNVLVRVDFNLPLDKKTGKIKDDTRIRLALPTINYILDQGAKKLIVMTHLGRPKGKVVKELSTKQVSERFAELLGEKVKFFNHLSGKDIPDDKIIMFENVQFSPGEKENDDKYAKKLAKYADVFIMDAFGQAHRKYASLVAIQKHITSYAGLLVKKEVDTITEAIDNPKKPFIAILGGVKLETKIPVIEHLLPKVDKILLCGAMIFTFYKTRGKEVGKSIVDDKELAMAEKILIAGEEKIVLPTDVIVSKSIEAPKDVDIVSVDDIGKEYYGLDIGPETIEEFKTIISCAKTVIWNGPMGLFEMEEFASGTMEIAKHIADLDATVIIGGGDSASAIRKAEVADKVTHISSGGGASLALFGGEKLPALEPLKEKAKKS